ncbi:phage holin family protein [Escherichia coli]
MTAEEKSVLSLFMIGVLIVVGKVLAGGEPITPRLFIGRMLLGGFVSMVAGVVLVQFPDLSLPAVCGIGSMLGIAGYQVIEIAIHVNRSAQRHRPATFVNHPCELKPCRLST